VKQAVANLAKLACDLCGIADVAPVYVFGGNPQVVVYRALQAGQNRADLSEVADKSIQSCVLVVGFSPEISPLS